MVCRSFWDFTQSDANLELSQVMYLEVVRIHLCLQCMSLPAHSSTENVLRLG